MNNWSVPPPMFDTESGEPLFGGYEPWFLPAGTRLAITKSDYLFLKANTDLCARGAIRPAQAQLNEANFIINGWDWVDNPKKQAHKKTYRKMVLEAMLLKQEPGEK